MLKLFIVIFYSTISFAIEASPFIIVSDPNPPYEYLNNQQPAGMDIEILQEIAKRQKIEFRFQFVPWARALNMVKEGKADAIISLLKTEDRLNFLHYPETPVYEDKILFFANKNFSQKPRSLTDLKGVRVGVVAGNSYGKEFDENTEMIKEVVSTQEMGMKKLAANRTPLFVINEIVGFHLIKELKAEGIYTLPIILSQDKYYLAISKKSPRSNTFLKIMDQGLKEAQKSGVLSEIKKKYLKK